MASLDNLSTSQIISGASPSWVAQQRAKNATDDQIAAYIKNEQASQTPTANPSMGNQINANNSQADELAPVDPNASTQLTDSSNVGDLIKGFGGNLVKSGTKAVAGLASLPGIALKGVTDRSTILPTIQGAVSGIGQEYGDLLTNNPIDINNPKSLLSKAYTDPVGLGLDITGVEGALKAAGAKLGISAAENIGPEAAAGAEAATKPIVDSAGVPDMSAKQFLNNFTIPRYVAKGVDQMATAKELLANGAGQFGSLSDMADHANQAVSTVSGLVQNVVDSVGSKTIDTPSILNKADELLSHVGGIDDARQARELGVIRRTINAAPNAMQAIRDLESQGYEYLKETTVSPTDAKLGNAYIKTAKEMSDALDQVAAKEDAVSAVKTPENMAKLAQISPRLAQEVQSADSVSALRSTIAPYVNLDKWVTSTGEAGQTAASNFGTKVARAAGKGAGALIGGGLGSLIPGVGPGVGAMGGMMAADALAPIAEAGAAKVLPKINNAIAQGAMNATSNGDNLVKGAIKAGAGATANAVGKIATPTTLPAMGENVLARFAPSSNTNNNAQDALANNNPDQAASAAESTNPFPQAKYLQYVAKDPFHAAYYGQLRDYYLGQQYKAGALARIDSIINLAPHATQLGLLGNKLNETGQVIPGINADPVTTKILQQLPIIEASIGHALGARVNPSSLAAIQAAIPTGQEKPAEFAQKMKTLKVMATQLMGDPNAAAGQ